MVYTNRMEHSQQQPTPSFGSAPPAPQGGSYADAYSPPQNTATPVQPAQTQATTNAPDTTNQPSFFPDYLKPQPEELFYEWQAPSRPFKKHNRNYYTTIAVIVLLISLILFFSGQFLPIAVVIAVAFLAYVLTAIPPQDILYQITSYGIRIEDKLYIWDVMGRFWYTEKYGQEILNVEVAQFPDRLTLVLSTADKTTITLILSEILLQQKPVPTLYERMAQWLQEKIPLDLDS